MATPRYEDVQVDSVFVIADNVYDVPGFSPGDEVRCASRTGIKATFEKVGGFETMCQEFSDPELLNPSNWSSL